ncbi:MAG: hypothetical protein Q7R79_00090 [bacterium]|nr:hypothetical protein [bacterium]
MTRCRQVLDRQIEIIDKQFSPASGMARQQLKKDLEFLTYQFMSMVFGRDYDKDFDTQKPNLYTMTGRPVEARKYLFQEEVQSGDDPVMIVIPEKLVSTSKKMNFVQVGGRTGHCDLLPYLIKSGVDVQELPDSPYILIGVDHGSLVSRETHERVLDFFKHYDAPQRRYAHNADEGAMLAAYYPEVLKKGDLVLGGSSYEKGFVPTIILDRLLGGKDLEARMVARKLEGQKGQVPSYLMRFWLDWSAIRYKRDTGSLSNVSERHT